MLRRTPVLVLLPLLWSGAALTQEVPSNIPPASSRVDHAVAVAPATAEHESGAEASLVFAPRQDNVIAKDPGTATLIAVIVPGGGHMYSGETSRGLMLFGVGVGGVIVGTAATLSSTGVTCSEFSCRDDTNYFPLLLGYGAYLGSWIYGIVDAGNSAHRMNAARGLAALPVNPQLMVQRRDDRRVALGLQVAF
jgi:hypothetical protein